MTKLLQILAVSAILFGITLAGHSVYRLGQAQASYQTREIPTINIPVALQPTLPSLSEPQLSAKSEKTMAVEVITLTDENMVVMDQAFTDESVTEVMQDLQKLSDKASKDSILYLVINSPGGSVTAGQLLISFARALPQKVKTLTIFSASMAFHTAQNLDERLIIDSGTLMSHRAKFAVSGETGQIQNRLNYIMVMLDTMDSIASDRMGLAFDVYRRLIHDEYWVYGQKAVLEKAADRVVLARCGKGTQGSRMSLVQTPFGAVQVELSKCPLMPGILSVGEAGMNQSQKEETLDYVKLMLNNRREFVNEIILKNKFETFFNRGN